MARVRNNILLQGQSGQIGKQIVLKMINGKTFTTKYPDRSHINYTEEQKEYRNIFADAARFASSIVKDPKKKAAYPRQGDRSVYHCALSDYMEKHKKDKAQKSNSGKIPNSESAKKKKK